MGIFVRNNLSNNLDPDEKAQGWRLLWDGKTTRGWRSANAEGFPAKGWSFADGALAAAPASLDGEPRRPHALHARSSATNGKRRARSVRKEALSEHAGPGRTQHEPCGNGSARHDEGAEQEKGNARPYELPGR